MMNKEMTDFHERRKIKYSSNLKRINNYGKNCAH